MKRLEARILLLGAAVVTVITVMLVIGVTSRNTSTTKSSGGAKRQISTVVSKQEKLPATTVSSIIQDIAEVERVAMQGTKFSFSEVNAIENKLKSNPDDIMSRIRLLGFYWQRQWKSDTARRAANRHRIWIITHKPAHPTAGSVYVRIDALLDKDEYVTAKKKWLKQIDKHRKNTTVLGNAANFFLLHDQILAETLLKKARSLEMENPEWLTRMGELYELEYIHRRGKERKNLARKCLMVREEAIKLIKNERKKFYMLNGLANAAFEAEQLKSADAYATELLQKAKTYKGDWNYGNAIHHGNIVLGKIALVSNQIEKAKGYLIKAGKTPGSPQLDTFGPDMTLAKELLEKEEGRTVIEYLTLCKKFWEMDNGRLLKWITLIRDGKIPNFQECTVVPPENSIQGEK